MAFIPYGKISYKTKLNYDEAVKRLQEDVEGKKLIRIIKGNQKKDYEGKFAENKFEIRRILMFSNVFSPEIFGTIKEENNEVKIDVKFKLRTIVLVVMSIWLGYVAYIFIVSLVNFIFYDIPSKNLTMSLLVLVVGYIFMTGAFKGECKKEKSKLEEILEIES